MTSWMTSQRVFNTNSVAKNINSLSSPDPVSGICICNCCWESVYVNYVHRLNGGSLFSAPLCSLSSWLYSETNERFFIYHVYCAVYLVIKHWNLLFFLYCCVTLWKNSTSDEAQLAVLCTIIMVHKDTSNSYRLVDCVGLWSSLVQLSVFRAPLCLWSSWWLKFSFDYILLFTF